MKRVIAILFSLLCLAALNCERPGSAPESEEEYVFAKGADVSWLTQMESESCLFYDRDGHQRECMALLKSLGMNSVRLRVWVSPDDGWCGKEDLLVKAKRAGKLGMRLMIDFHYSDSWADPGKQNKPAAWASLDFEALKKALADHTSDILNALKSAGITPEWIQAGNETTNGMLWEDGRNNKSFAKYVQLHNAGYDAAKAVFPEAKVMVHVDNGHKWSTLNWFFDAFSAQNAKFDMIALSLYPDKSRWQECNQQIINNINTLYAQYGKETIICETGMDWNEAETCRDFLNDLISRATTGTHGHCTGVFYWEPEAYHSWSGYGKAAFDNSGRPTLALDAFKNREDQL